MNITEVRVKLMRNRSDRLRAFCSITIDDDFVIHDLRVIEGRKGYFVAMPSRKLTDNCPACGSKNELRAAYCNNCGGKLDPTRATQDPNARDKFHVDVAHPINTPCREMIQETVLAAYEAELDRVEEGLEPQRQYDEEGLDELIDDYDEYGDEECLAETDEAPGPQVHEVAETQPATEPEEPQVAETGPEPGPERTETTEAGPAAPQAEPAPGPIPVSEPEFELGADEEEQEEEPPEEDEEDTGFGAGLF